MNKAIPIFILTCLLIFHIGIVPAQQVFPTVAGGYITYEPFSLPPIRDVVKSLNIEADKVAAAQANSDYLIKVRLFIPCSTATGLPSGINIACTSYQLEYAFSAVASNPRLIREINNNCEGSDRYCIREYEYEAFVTFPMAASWIISYGEANRYNVSSSNGGKFYIESVLNNDSYPDETSVVFNNKPAGQLCKGKEFSFNPGAFDADKNKLKYTLISPKVAARTDLVYNTGYSFNKPFGNTSLTSLDVSSGTLKAVPDQETTTYLAILVEEFDREGRFVSSVIYDQMMNVKDCSTNLPPLITGSFPVTITDQSRGCFSIQVTDTEHNPFQVFVFPQNFQDFQFLESTDQFNYCFTPRFDNTTDIEYLFFVVVLETVACNPQIAIATFKVTITPSVASYCLECIPGFSPSPREKYLLTAWVKEQYLNNMPGSYTQSGIRISFNDGKPTLPLMKPSGPVIEGWQRIEQEFEVPANASSIEIELVNDNAAVDAFFDDIRIHPFRSNMKSFVYDPSSQKLVAELDENNYATRYEYDDEGQLVRVKKETERGLMTIRESRMNQSKINVK